VRERGTLQDIEIETRAIEERRLPSVELGERKIRILGSDEEERRNSHRHLQQQLLQVFVDALGNEGVTKFIERG
jgi:hypothetical protein